MFRGILIVILICVIILAAFALQNTGLAAMKFFNFVIPVVPLYAVVIVSAALGAIITALVAVWARVGLNLRGRPVRRKAVEQEKAVADLSGQVTALQAERDELTRQVDQSNLELKDLHSRIAGLEMGLSLAQAEANKPVVTAAAISPSSEPVMVVPTEQAAETTVPVTEESVTAEPMVRGPTEQAAETTVPVTEELVAAEPHHWWSPS